MSESPLSTGPIVLDLDDFCEQNHSLELLDGIAEEIGPEFRVNLFTIPGKTSPSWLVQVRATRPWIRCYPHGWHHGTSRECEHWTYSQICGKLRAVEPFRMEKGWKSPGWRINLETYIALLNSGYWVADKVEHRSRRPALLMAYEVDEPRKIHGHIGHWMGHNPNELSLIRSHILRSFTELAAARDRGLYTGPLFGWCGDELKTTGDLDRASL